jgi:H+/Cl- antiporter ClcA
MTATPAPDPVTPGPAAPPPETHRFRVLLPAAAGMGAVGVGAAWCLLRLIWLLTNLIFWHRLSAGYAEASVAPRAVGLFPLLPLVGGSLVAGLAIRYGHESLSGHGIPEVMEAVLQREARIPWRVALFKPLVSAIVIGAGGPFGAEGPIIQTGAALGSLAGQLLPLNATERKMLLACGAAAGMTGVFGTPLAAVLLPLELLTFEFSLRAIAPVAVAAAVAAVLRVPLLGSRPLFAMTTAPGAGPIGLLWCLGFGLLGGLEAAGLTRALYGLEDLYGRLPGPAALVRPVVGAVCVGLVALGGPQVLGVGYNLIRAVLDGTVGVPGLARILVLKAGGWLLALASGTVGGVLAPVFLVAGATGALLGHAVRPWSGLTPSLVALVFMAAVFGASSRAVLTAAIFAVEVTGDFRALPAVLLATAVAAAAAERLLPYTIMTGKLARRGLRVNLDAFAPAAGSREPEAGGGRRP